MKSPNNSCPRCGGSGKLPFRRAGGVCFQCEGTGLAHPRTPAPTFTPRERAEAERAMAWHRGRLARLATLPAAPATAPATATAPAPASATATEGDAEWFWSLFPQS